MKIMIIKMIIKMIMIVLIITIMMIRVTGSGGPAKWGCHSAS